MQKYAVYMKDMQKSIYYIYCIICTPRFAEFVMSLTRCRNWRPVSLTAPATLTRTVRTGL